MKTVVQDVSVVPMVDSDVLDHMDVVLDREIIKGLYPTGRRHDAAVVDGAGKYLFPGLSDMHIHGLERPNSPELFLLNGITFVRDMGSRETIFEWKRKHVPGRDCVPDYIVSGPILEGVEDPLWEFSIRVSGEEAARRAVGKLQEGGADFVKLYHTMEKKDFTAAADEAKRLGMQVAGHPHSGLDIQNLVYTLGSFEHAYMVAMREEYTKYDSKWCTERLANRMKSNRRVLCPTLLVHKRMERAQRDFEGLVAENRGELAYARQDTQDKWREQIAYLKSKGYEITESRLKLADEITGWMHETGVSLIAGTDAGNPFVFPGSSLHEEIECLMELGIPQYDVLKMTTVNPARFFGRSGTITAGSRASLVLVENNPLRKVETLRNPTDVFVRGRHFSRGELEGRLVKRAGS